MPILSPRPRQARPPWPRRRTGPSGRASAAAPSLRRGVDAPQQLALAHHVPARRQREHRRPRPVGGDQPHGGARVGRRHDRLEPELVDGAHRAEGDRVVLVVRLRPALGQPAAVGQLALGGLARSRPSSPPPAPGTSRRRSPARASPRRCRRRSRWPRRPPRRASGGVEWTIDSSIWVAVIVGFARRPATARMRFWTSGTSSIGSSMPRSPRAIMMPSAASTISSPLAAACGFSILAISGTSRPRAARCSRTGSRSSRRRTNESAKKSSPISSPASISADVLGADGRQRDRDVGQVEALPRGDAAAHLHLGHHLAVDDLVHAQPHRAVGEVADVARVDQLGEARPGHRQPLGGALDRRPGVSTTRAPRPSSATPPATGPSRSLGPGRSPRIATSRPTLLRGRADRGARSRRAARACRARSSAGRRPCPRRSSPSRTSGSCEAGPIVATIFVERMAAPWNILTKSPLLADGWPSCRLTLASRAALIGAGLRRVGPGRERTGAGGGSGPRPPAEAPSLVERSRVRGGHRGTASA